MEYRFEKVSLIAGAGTVVNSWLPIIKVLQPLYYFDFDPDSANCFLARMIYSLRFLATSTDPKLKSFYNQALMEFNEIKKRISIEICNFEKSQKIFPRKEFSSIVTKFLFKDYVQFVLISTNWDTIIDKAVNNTGQSKEFETFHLHGIASIPNEIYLPSEIAKEPYRTEQEGTSILRKHASALNAIAESNRVILYGLSLDPLDAELSQILSMGLDSSNIKEIVIINPDHKKVSNRVKVLVNDHERKIDIFAYVPHDLSTKIQY